MKKKIFSLLALVMTAMAASATDVPAFQLIKGMSEHGTITFKVGENTDASTAQEGQTVTVTLTPTEGWAAGQTSGIWLAAVAASRRVAGAEIELMDSVELTPVSGKDNEWTFTMERADAKISATYRKLLTHADISIGDIADVTYNGSEQKPDVTVKDGDKTLELDKDYTVAYSNNVNAGDAKAENAPTATITGIGDYAGTVTKTFTIKKSTDAVHFNPWWYEKSYGDPKFTVTPVNKSGGTLTYKSTNTDVATVDPSTGEVTILAAGSTNIRVEVPETANYDGSNDWYELTVLRKLLNAAMIGEIAGQAYTGEALTPAVTVKDGEKTLVLDTDYTVAYKNNTETGEATVTVTGSGNYTGSVSKTFTIAMAKLTLDEETANGEALDGADGKWYDVTLKRTLHAGMWNTFAVPFAVDAATLTAMGLTAKALTGSSVDGQMLTLHFADATAIEAGKPYLVKAAETVTDPVFGKVQVSKTAVPAVTAAADFVPTLGKTEMKADDAKSVLFLTSGNKLQYPASLPADFKGFRAYFQLKGAAATARSFELDIDGETTAISAVSGSPADNGAVYTLDGRKVTNPAKKGVYIVNGKKVIIK